MWILARSNRACGLALLVLLFGAWNAVSDGEVGVVSTLLGPEGTRVVRGVTSEPQGFFRVQTGRAERTELGGSVVGKLLVVV